MLRRDELGSTGSCLDLGRRAVTTPSGPDSFDSSIDASGDDALLSFSAAANADSTSSTSDGGTILIIDCYCI